MILEITSNGRLAIKDVTESAWEYINTKRDSACLARDDHFCFSKNYEGTVYLNDQYQEDQEWLLREIDVIMKEHGLIISAHAKRILDSWREYICQENAIQRWYERAKTLKESCKTYFNHQAEGCAYCKFFAIEQDGDVDVGICKHSNEELKFGGQVSAGIVKGGNAKVTGFASTWYPCENCYYKDEIKKSMEEI